MINEKRLLEEFLELVKVDSPTRKERAVAEVIKTKLVALGAEISEDDAGEKLGGNCGNIFAYIKGNVSDAPTIMLSAHMDCVSPCEGVVPIVENGIIRTNGQTVLGGDDKGGIAAILEGIRSLKEQNIPFGDVQVVLTIAEEGGVNGSKNLDKSFLKADFGYALDGTGAPGQIINMAPGQNKINIVVHGTTAHAGIAPEEGVNAIILAGKALSQIKQGRIDFETTANIGSINGGGATNIVPDRIEIVAEARSRNMKKLKAQTEHMVKTFENIVSENGGRAEVTVNKAYEPFVLAEDEPSVKLAVKASEACGLATKVLATGGGSDANFFCSYGVPCVVLSIGMSKVHTKEEYISEEHLQQTTHLVMEILKQAAK